MRRIFGKKKNRTVRKKKGTPKETTPKRYVSGCPGCEEERELAEAQTEWESKPRICRLIVKSPSLQHERRRLETLKQFRPLEEDTDDTFRLYGASADTVRDRQDRAYERMMMEGRHEDGTRKHTHKGGRRGRRGRGQGRRRTQRGPKRTG